MKTRLIIAFVTFCFISINQSLAQEILPYQWIKISDESEVRAQSIGIDNLGNCYVLARYNGDPVFMGQAPDPIVMTQGVFVAKVNPVGNLLWIKFSEGDFDEEPILKVLPNGRYYFVAQFRNNVYLDESTPTIPSNTANSADIVIAAFDSSGNYEWSLNSNANTDIIYPVAIDVDENYNIYVGATLDNANAPRQVDFGTESFQFSEIDEQGLILKYNHDLILNQPAFQWAKLIKSTDIPYENDRLFHFTGLACDRSGDVYITGLFGGILEFESGITRYATVWDHFLVKYESSAGALEWVKILDGEGDDRPGILQIDPFDNIYITGVYHMSLNLGSMTLSTPNDHEGFVAKYNPTGNLLWAKNDEDNSYELYTADKKIGSGVDSYGNFYLVGKTDNSAFTHSSYNIIKYQANGTYDWISTSVPSTTGSFSARDIVFDNFDNAYVLGNLLEDGELISSICNSNFMFANSGQRGVTLARLWFNSGIILVNSNVCAGERLTFACSQFEDVPYATYNWTFIDGTNQYYSTLPQPEFTFPQMGEYEVQLSISYPGNCEKEVSTLIYVNDCVPPVLCEDCISSFAPTVGKTYVLSAWVKQVSGTTNFTTYDDAKIQVSFVGNSALYTFSPSGEIIDGWQKIEQSFFIPNDAQHIKIGLKNESDDSDLEAFFDDIRIVPFDANMKSFVYDPANMRLVAELDNQNYATFYEYDEDGALVRVKKETAKGVETIKESRKNIKK